MRHAWSEKVKQALRPALFRSLYRDEPSFRCPICAYRGPFKEKRVSRRPDIRRPHSKCVGCGATERHRMLHLVIDDVLTNWQASRKSLLHIAPEFCLQQRLSDLFGTYHTADLFQPGVDFREDIQRMSFADGTYDCAFISRVLMIPEDLEACVRELRRVLKPGGLAIIAETYTRERTVEFPERRDEERIREIGLDALDLYAKHFARVEPFTADRYPADYQLLNRVCVDGRPRDDYPALVRVPGVGFKDVVAVCHV